MESRFVSAEPIRSDRPDDDRPLVDRARAGEAAAFGALVRRHQHRVVAFAQGLVGGSRADAEDVAQEAFVRAYRGLSKFDGRSELFTWLYRITVNSALNHMRTMKRQRVLARAGADRVAHHGGRPEAPGVAPPTPEEGVTLSRRTQRVFDALAELSESLRITLVLASVEALPYRKIAEILEIPEGTVAWRVNEARKQLRAKLAETADAVTEEVG